MQRDAVCTDSVRAYADCMALLDGRFTKPRNSFRWKFAGRKLRCPAVVKCTSYTIPPAEIRREQNCKSRGPAFKKAEKKKVVSHTESESSEI